MKHHSKITSVQITELHPGDYLELHTANSKYQFWVEYPEQSIGILCGGILPIPTRVRLTAEDESITEPSKAPLVVGERAKTTLIDPTGQPVRCVITSSIASIVVVPNKRKAA